MDLEKDVSEGTYEGRRHVSRGTYPEPGYCKELVKLSSFSQVSQDISSFLSWSL